MCGLVHSTFVSVPVTRIGLAGVEFRRKGVMREDFGPSGDGHRRQQNSEDVLHGVCSIIAPSTR